MRMTQIRIAFSPNQIQALSQKANELGVSIASVVRSAVASKLKLKKEKQYVAIRKTD